MTSFSSWLSTRTRCLYCDVYVESKWVFEDHTKLCFHMPREVKELWRGFSDGSSIPTVPWKDQEAKPGQKKTLEYLTSFLRPLPSERKEVLPHHVAVHDFLLDHLDSWTGRVPVAIGACSDSLSPPKVVHSWQKLQPDDILKDLFDLPLDMWLKTSIVKSYGDETIVNEDCKNDREKLQAVKLLKSHFSLWTGTPPPKKNLSPPLFVGHIPSYYVRCAKSNGFPPDLLPLQEHDEYNSLDAVFTPPDWVTFPHLDCPIVDSLVYTIQGCKIWLLWPAIPNNLVAWEDYLIENISFPSIYWCMTNLHSMDVVLAMPRTAFVVPAGTIHVVLTLDDFACHTTAYGLFLPPTERTRSETLSDVDVPDAGKFWKTFVERYRAEVLGKRKSPEDIQKSASLLGWINGTTQEIEDSMLMYDQAEHAVDEHTYQELRSIFYRVDGRMDNMKMELDGMYQSKEKNP